MKVYIFLSGNNDLVYPIRKTLNLVINESKYEAEALYSLDDRKSKVIINKNDKEELYLNKVQGYISINKNGIIEKNEEKYYNKYIFNNEEFKTLDFIKFLDGNILNSEDNIVIISGHGGPFQGLLDINDRYPFSINTRRFIENISKYNIDLLYLDMCAMNYIEVIYELMKNTNIKRILTYKGQAPYEAQNYNELIESINNSKGIESGIVKYLERSKVAIIYIKNDDKNLEACKSYFNNFAIKCIDENEADFVEDIKILKEKLSEFIVESDEAKKIKGLQLNCIKYYLEDKVDRVIYNKYKFNKNNKYRYLVSKDENEEEPDIIMLDRESLTHIIWLHNTNLNQEELEALTDKVLSQYIKNN